MLTPAHVAPISFVFCLLFIIGYPDYYARKSVRCPFKAEMTKNWYIAFTSAGVAVMFGAEITKMLLHFSVSNAISYAGIIGGLHRLDLPWVSLPFHPYSAKLT